MNAVVGTSVRRSDGDAKVRGDAVYGFDHVEAGMLHAKLLRSPVAAGRIVHLDTTAALALPGVRAICTAADMPEVVGGWMVKDQPAFAREEVRYKGEPIAAIAADTLAQAEAAVAAIELQIEELEALTTPDQALAPGARTIHPDVESYGAIGASAPRGNNVNWHSRVDRGDVAAAFEAAHLVVEDEISVPRQHQSSIEPHAAVARYESGRFVIHSCTQYPYLVRDRVSELFGIPPTQVRVLVTAVGGGFGGKLDMLLEVYPALLARTTGRPVRLANTRREELETAGPRENATVRLRTAVAADGAILAQEGWFTVDNGAYSGETPGCATAAPLATACAYRIPAVAYDVTVAYTNSPPTAAFRGVCGPYCVLAQEVHLDHIARELGMDRRAFRARNVIRAGESMINGQPLPDAAVVEAMERLQALAPWSPDAEPSRPGRLRGTAIVPLVWLTNPSPSGANVKLNEDGSVTVISGGAEIGTGAMTTGVRQIVADELGVSVDQVLVAETDTDSGTYDGGAQGSRTTFGIGAAALNAAEGVREQIQQVAADMLEASPGDIELVDGAAVVAGSPEARVDLAAVALTALWGSGPISSSGKFITPPLPFDAGCLAGGLLTAFGAPSFHAHQVEVEVDPETGHVEVMRYAIVQDVGKVINPQMIEGQVQGAVMQGIGYALFEELRVEDGLVLDGSLEHYRVPTVADRAPIALDLMEIPCAYGPLGVKGAAEPPIIPVAAALACAVTDAIGATPAFPMTPFRVLEALATTH